MVITDSLENCMMGFQPGLYWIIDPLCGWSYGALPLLNRVAQDFTQQHILPGDYSSAPGAESSTPGGSRMFMNMMRVSLL
jgi:protein-disulfide isomerase-like protein with CxxC motif